MRLKKLNNIEKLIELGLTDEEIRNRIKTFCSRKKDYWIERGFSEDESNVMRLSKTPGTYEYFVIYKKLSPSEASEKVKNWKNNSSVTLVNMINRYGEEEGTRRFNVYREKQAYSNTLEYFINKYGKEKGTEKYLNANEKRAITLENLINKHGEEIGKEKWNDYVEKQRYVGCKLEYFIEKYGNVEGTQKYKELSIKKSNTYESYLVRCNGNEELAKKKYKDYLKNRSESNRVSYSTVSQNLFDCLKGRLFEYGLTDMFYATYNQEWYVINKNGFVCYVDFFLKDKGKIIEFNGDYWHGNPNIYKNGQVINFPKGEKVLVDDLWKKDKMKLDLLRKIPYIKDILVIWESDYYKNKERIEELCMEFLLN
jgi:hypothetical protein